MPEVEPSVSAASLLSRTGQPDPCALLVVQPFGCLRSVSVRIHGERFVPTAFLTGEELEDLLEGRVASLVSAALEIRRHDLHRESGLADVVAFTDLSRLSPFQRRRRRWLMPRDRFAELVRGCPLPARHHSSCRNRSDTSSLR